MASTPVEPVPDDPRIGDLRYSVSPTAQLSAAEAAHTQPAAPGTQEGVAGRAVVSPTAKDTLWADTSYYQAAVNFSVYPYLWYSCRSNDGTFVDPKFQLNLALSKQALDTKRLQGLIVYVVYRPNWQSTLATLEKDVGVPHPLTVYMIDVESWGGAITGDQTAGIEALRKGIIAWLQSHLTPAQKAYAPYMARQAKRVIAYGNSGDMSSLYRGRPAGVKWVLANYSSNPSFGDKIAHQFSSSFYVPGFGNCDINSADGYDSAHLQTELGISPMTIPDPKPQPPQDTHDPVLNGLYAAGWGKDYGPYTHANHPFLVPGPGHGFMDRLARIEHHLGLKP
jgi:hypothetical protein